MAGGVGRGRGREVGEGRLAAPPGIMETFQGVVSAVLFGEKKKEKRESRLTRD